MPALNKQTLINLLIDSPLREPIKINLIDIVNNTGDADLPKTYSTISKELEIFQKATERRMKLADETIAKLSAEGTPDSTPPTAPQPNTPTAQPNPPPEPPAPPTPPAPTPLPEPPTMPSTPDALAVPPLDLPPLPTPPSPTENPSMSAPEPTPLPPLAKEEAAGDEDALKEIQKELDALKNSASADIKPSDTPPAPPAN